MAISHHGDARTTLRGQRAVEFFGEVEAVGEQGLMARRTGHYRRGNERPPPNHPRNMSRWSARQMTSTACSTSA